MIEKKFHFIFGLSENFGGKPFGIVHYLAIKSAITVNNPDSVFFYYAYEPKSKYFQLIKPYLNLIRIKPPNSIFGNCLNHVAHKADVVRLLVLYCFGGIYLDLDTICVKPFDDILDNPCVLGHEKTSKNDGKALCNAVILAKKKSSFFKTLAEYLSNI